VVLMRKYNLRTTTRSAAHGLIRALAWLVAVLFLLNTLYFVLRATSPVIRDDAWYFLDVFLRKAINGNLSPGDFFVRRAGEDHAQPLLKLLMLFEWRYFSLDFTVGAVVGVLAAAACALVFYRVIVAEGHNDHGDAYRYLAWSAICAVLFSLNADAAVWTWPLVALGNVTNLIILLFFLVTGYICGFAMRFPEYIFWMPTVWCVVFLIWGQASPSARAMYPPPLFPKGDGGKPLLRPQEDLEDIVLPSEDGPAKPK